MTGTEKYATVGELRQAISTEALVAAGVPRKGALQTLLRPLVWFPCDRFARLAAEFDRHVAQDGFAEATRLATSFFVDSSQVLGAEHIPATGPLVAASNHPGSYDGLLIASAVGRNDLRVLVSDVPFLRHMRGQVDPDPALLPGAREELQKWSPSLSLFVRQVPETVILVSIVSGVLAPSCFRHPLTRLRKEQRLKQFLAEFIQISQQVLFGRRFGLTPTVRFAEPLTAADLGGGRDAEIARATILARAESLLADVPAEGACIAPSWDSME
jgi:hypothetical protein